MHPLRRLALAALALLGATAAAAAPARVVSMNLCTDQLAMLLAAEGQLVAVSRVARDPVSSAMAAEAATVPVHNGQAEAIHALAPDLVLAGAYDAPATLEMLRRLGHRIERFPVETGFDDIRANVTRMGRLLGTEARAAALLAGMDAVLAAPPEPGPRPRAALYAAGGYTSGAGTLAHEVLEAAGFANVAAEAGRDGFSHLPLETLVTARPDLLILGRQYASPAHAEAVLAHPALAAISDRTARVDDTLWTCGTPRTARAVATLRALRRP